MYSRTPYGVRGLKYFVVINIVTVEGRTPYGVRGLKFKSVTRFRKQRGVALLTECVD